MSTEITTIPNTGKKDKYLTVTQFYGGSNKGVMLQLTQGLGSQHEPGFIQLTKVDCDRLIDILTRWLESHD